MNTMESYFKKAHKADVHNHFHIGGSQQAFFKLYPNKNIVFPKKHNGLEGMINFINNRLNTVLTSRDDVINFMNISIESSIADNVTYLEASVDVNLARFFNNSIDGLIKAIKHIKETYKSQIEFKPDIGINKDLPINKVYDYGEALIDSGIFYGIDIYGKEAHQNIHPFINLYKTAKKNKIKTKVHIGEFSDFKSIETVILLLNPDEIQHGINAVYSKKTIAMILERDIQLNICPQSNISLGAVKNLKSHPVRPLFDKGISLTINTDDLMLFNTTVSQQMIDLVDQNVFSFDEMNSIRKNAFPSTSKK